MYTKGKSLKTQWKNQKLNRKSNTTHARTRKLYLMLSTNTLRFVGFLKNILLLFTPWIDVYTLNWHKNARCTRTRLRVSFLIFTCVEINKNRTFLNMRHTALLHILVRYILDSKSILYYMMNNAEKKQIFCMRNFHVNWPIETKKKVEDQIDRSIKCVCDRQHKIVSTLMAHKSRVARKFCVTFVTLL